MTEGSKDATNFIGYLVEKVTKGVKKQIKGYVREIQSQIEYSKRRVDLSIDEFERLIKSSYDMKKDWGAVVMMLKEQEQNKKLMYEMHVLYQETRNELMNMKLLNIELQQKLQGNIK